MDRPRAAWPLKGSSDVGQEISSWIVEWFVSRGKPVGSSREALQVDYLQSGLLTSLEIVELVAAIEDHYGVQFSEADMQDPRFPTIGGMSELVAVALNRDQSERATFESADSRPDERSRAG
jgi:acyl carrier protein